MTVNSSLLLLLSRLVVMNVVGVLVRLPALVLDSNVIVEVDQSLSLSLLAVVPLDGAGYVLDDVISDDGIMEEVSVGVELMGDSVLEAVSVEALLPLGGG